MLDLFVPVTEDIINYSSSNFLFARINVSAVTDQKCEQLKQKSLC